MEKKLKRKPLSSPVSVKAVWWKGKGWGLWREGFKEYYSLNVIRPTVKILIKYIDNE